jgi:hypothetical protein
MYVLSVSSSQAVLTILSSSCQLSEDAATCFCDKLTEDWATCIACLEDDDPDNTDAETGYAQAAVLVNNMCADFDIDGFTETSYTGLSGTATATVRRLLFVVSFLLFLTQNRAFFSPCSPPPPPLPMLPYALRLVPVRNYSH